MPLQKPVPRSNQSLFLSSYTLTRLRSLAGGATNAIVEARAYEHSSQGQHALRSEARDRDALRRTGRQCATVTARWWMFAQGARWRMTMGQDRRLDGAPVECRDATVGARTTAPGAR
jgi:hypothetical protein